MKLALPSCTSPRIMPSRHRCAERCPAKVGLMVEAGDDCHCGGVGGFKLLPQFCRGDPVEPLAWRIKRSAFQTERFEYLSRCQLAERLSGYALEDKPQEDVVEIAVEHFLRGRLFNPFEGPRDCGRDLLACLCFQIERKPVGKRRSVNK